MSMNKFDYGSKARIRTRLAVATIMLMAVLAGTAAQAAIAGLQGTELKGRTINVNEARPREPRREPRRPRW